MLLLWVTGRWWFSRQGPSHSSISKYEIIFSTTTFHYWHKDASPNISSVFLVISPIHSTMKSLKCLGIMRFSGQQSQQKSSHKLILGQIWLSSIKRIFRPLLPEYIQNTISIILDEYTCIILAITALIWKHVLYGKLVFSFFSNPGFRGVMGAIALSEHAWLNEEIDFVNEKCNRWWL